MWLIRTCCILSILLTFCVSQGLTSEKPSISKQVATIVDFYEVIAADAQPKASDFFRLFGEENKAELELILTQQFPKVDIRTWLLEPEAHQYVNRVYENPSQYVSRFMVCLRKTRPDLFFSKGKWQIESPPEITGDFKNYKVTVSGKTMIFQGGKRYLGKFFAPIEFICAYLRKSASLD